MQVPAHDRVRNRLLAALSLEDYEAVRAVAEPVPLPLKDGLIAPDTPIAHVWFPESGIVSLVAITEENDRIEVGIVGREGLAGAPLVLGVDRTPHEYFVQVEGTALRLPTTAFVALLEERQGLRTLMMRYLHVFQLQSAQTTLANGAYDIIERLARWLLMCDDRLDGPEFQLTHVFLSMMLGVRRPGVTTAMHILEGMGAIQARRARITILDRDRLVELAGGSYGGAEREYGRLIEGGGRTPPASD